MTITLNVDERSYCAGDIVCYDVDKRVTVHIDAIDGNLELARRAEAAAVEVIKENGKEKCT